MESTSTGANEGSDTERSEAEKRALIHMRKLIEASSGSTPPRDAVTGALTATGTIVFGVLGAVGAVVTLPVVGAYSEGATGFVKGLLSGIGTACLVIPLAAVAGTQQVLVGLANTPETTYRYISGYTWDPVDEIWRLTVPYSLKQEAAAILKEEDDFPEEAGTRSGKKVADQKYYEILGVDPAASAGEIRRAYYLEARKTHPDKHPNDATAHAKFVELGEAYQVLSNEHLRRRYDEHGPGATDQSQIVDPAIFFTMMFGSEQFEPYVGQLKVARLAAAWRDEDGDVTKQHQMRGQRRRECELAVKLAERLDKGLSERWVEAMETEACSLADAPFGEMMLLSTSWSYANAAARCGLHQHDRKDDTSPPLEEKKEVKKEQDGSSSSSISWYSLPQGKDQSSSWYSQPQESSSSWYSQPEGKDGSSWYSQLEAAACSLSRTVGNSIEVANLGVETLSAAQGLQTIASNQQPPQPPTGDLPTETCMQEQQQQERLASEARVSEAVLEMVAQITLMDVEETIANVCWRVLTDTSVSPETRVQRALALSRLAEIFAQAKSSHVDKVPLTSVAAAARAAACRV